MNGVADSFDEKAVMRGVDSVRHPLTRALLVLTFTTGLIDAASYLGLGRVFTANMTGNVVLLGFGVAGSSGLPVAAPVASLAAFFLGSVGGGALIRRVSRKHPVLVARALAIETSLLTASMIVAAATHTKPGAAAAYAIIILLAFAMGVRSTVVRHIGVPDLSTVVLTMLLTSLASRSPLAGGSGRGSSPRLAAVVAMFTGAVAGALLLKTELFIPLALAAMLALLTWLLYAPALRRLGHA